MQRMYTPSDISEILGINYEKSLEFIRCSGIPYIKIGRTYHVTAAVLERFLETDKPVIVNLDQG